MIQRQDRKTRQYTTEDFRSQFRKCIRCIRIDGGIVSDATYCPYHQLRAFCNQTVSWLWWTSVIDVLLKFTQLHYIIHFLP